MKFCLAAGRRAVPLAASLLTGAASAITLYDPGLGLPADQQWTTSGIGSFSQAVTAGHYQLSTAPSNASVAGSARLQPLLLDTLIGFSLDFGLRIAGESHAADNQRAGFSMIVTGADPTHALELGFWQNEVFAYDASFAPNSASLFDTTVATAYSLVVDNNQYRLLGNGSTLLSGSLVDYTGRNIAPYTTAGALFFGDDTSRAQSVSELGVVSLTPAVPEPATVLLLAAGLLGLAGWQCGRRRRAHVSLAESAAVALRGRSPHR